MDVGNPVWILNENEIWCEASVVAVNNSSDTIECSLRDDVDDDNEHVDNTVSLSCESTIVPAPTNLKRNISNSLASVSKDKVRPRNPTENYHSVNDLTKLVHLHEPAILQVLRERFSHGHIYTSTGTILVALNPFRRLDLYSETIQDRYYTLGHDAEAVKQLPPHVYGVADKAFRTMLSISATSETNDTPCNQTILVSGESGAGKTETTKLIMNYLAFVSCKRKAVRTTDMDPPLPITLNRKLPLHPTSRTDRSLRPNSHTTSIHDRVLESNPILEAFGNARTNRNNNSSRFGKFIKLGFGKNGEMLGATISTYLLERVRLVSQARGERNYHIFYELLRGASTQERQQLELLNVDDYLYLNQSGCTTRLDGVDDAVAYQGTRHAMDSIGMSLEEQTHVMQVVAAVLHLGNLMFIVDKNKETCRVDNQNPKTVHSLGVICKLLGMDSNILQQTLCTKQIQAGGELITVQLSLAQAMSTRDSIVKILYTNLFTWLVTRINTSIHYTEEYRFIGVVDIFGFEIFEQNSLEQLCINYANEKLQQLFSRFVFQMEQEQYMEENIIWQFITYPNNDPCVVLLEQRHTGLFALMDEQCLIPKGSDDKLANKVYELVEKYDSFSASKLERAQHKFVIHHYAGNVCYTSQGFCEKNKDHMHLEVGECMKTSHSTFIRMLFMEQEETERKSGANIDPTRRRSSGIMSPTVVAQFKTQLTTLLDTINLTQPHFIRCIKPNDVVSPTVFDRKRLMEQLRCSGVLEAVKISRSGYPVRFLHQDFIHTYRWIFKKPFDVNWDTPTIVKTMTQYFVHEFQELESTSPPFQVGKTRVFCVQSAYQVLESARIRILYQYVVTIQRYCLGYSKRCVFQLQRRRIIIIQSLWRRYQCRKRFLYTKRSCTSAIQVQRIWRGYISRRNYHQVKMVILIQRMVRGWLIRREYANTLSFERDASYVGDLMIHEPHSKILNPLLCHSITSSERTSIADINDPDPHVDSNGSSFLSSRTSSVRSAPMDYVPPNNRIQTEYEIVWECGLLGLYFETDPESGMPIVRRVHESLSNCADIFEVSRGDFLLAVGKEQVRKGDIRRILQLLQEVEKPVHLRFQRGCATVIHERSGSIELLGEEDYEVLWREGVPLGLGFRPDPESGFPVVFQAHGNQDLPGMFNVRMGDYLTFINEFSTHGIRFQKVIDILESGPRPSVLRFRHNDANEELQFSNPQEDDPIIRRSSVILNPKNDQTLYYITWKEEDGPLGIVVKQESTSYYPRVINVKNEGAVSRDSQKNRVEVGDVLLSINNNSISKMGFGAAMKLLQRGPKPLLLMFQRPQLGQSFSFSPNTSITDPEPPSELPPKRGSEKQKRGSEKQKNGSERERKLSLKLLSGRLSVKKK